MSSSVHVDNKGKYILILRSGPTKRAFINCTIKGKDSKVLAAPLCLENIQKDRSVDNMKKTGFYGYVYDFSVVYDAIAVDDIKNIHK